MSTTIYTAPPRASESALRFPRATFDILRKGERVTVEGYRIAYAPGTRTHGGDEPTPPPWGIARGRRGWDVSHIPTGLLVLGDLATLTKAKALCATLESSTATAGWNLPALAAQPFGKMADEEGTPARTEALAVWEVMRAWQRATA